MPGLRPPQKMGPSVMGGHWQNPTSLILLSRVNIETSGRYAEMQELWQEDPMVYGFQKPFVAAKLEGLKFFPFRDIMPRMCSELE